MFTTRVLNGAEWLDGVTAFDPAFEEESWDDLINLGTLNLESSSFCILGQLWEWVKGDLADNWGELLEAFDLTQDEAAELGFCLTDEELGDVYDGYDNLSREWAEFILARWAAKQLEKEES